MKKLILFLILIGFFAAGKAQDVALLRKDPNIIIVKKITDKLKARYYKMPSNMSSLQSEIVKNPSPENMKMILKKNGMADADQFVDDLMLQKNAMVRFNKNHPEFMKLQPAKRMEVMKQLLSND